MVGLKHYKLAFGKTTTENFNGMKLTLEIPPKIYVNFACDIICPIFQTVDDEDLEISRLCAWTLEAEPRIRHLAIDEKGFRLGRVSMTDMNLDTLTAYHQLPSYEAEYDYDVESIGLSQVGRYTRIESMNPYDIVRPLQDLANVDDLETLYLSSDAADGAIGSMPFKQEVIAGLQAMENARPLGSTWTAPEVKYTLLRAVDGNLKPNPKYEYISKRFDQRIWGVWTRGVGVEIPRWAYIAEQ